MYKRQVISPLYKYTTYLLSSPLHCYSLSGLLLFIAHKYDFVMIAVAWLLLCVCICCEGFDAAGCFEKLCGLLPSDSCYCDRMAQLLMNTI